MTLVRRVGAVSEDLRRWMLDTWVAVTDAGGAVGFLPGATPDDIAPTLDESLAHVAAGRWAMGVLEVDGVLAGFGFLERYTAAVMRGRAKLLRLQVHPSQAGRGRGRALLAGLEHLAREDGLHLLDATYRGGMGLGAFYAACGWQEVGRIPDALTVAPGDLRDEVIVARWL